MGQVLLFAFSLALGILVPAGIVWWDLSRLTGEKLARSWPDAGVWSAVVVFGFLSVPVHFLRTRRSWLGLVLAVLWLVCALALILAPPWALGRIFHIDE